MTHELRSPGAGGDVSVGLYYRRDNLQFHRGSYLVLLKLDAAEQTRDLLEHDGQRLDNRLFALGC